MDKYEYKVRAEEIHALIREGRYGEAVDIADTIDWRRVKSIKTLCTISDLYKANRRYQESKEILLMAYERYPGGRLIVYSLCELSIKLEEYVQAIEYYKEYVQLAPKDSSRYILQYRLYEAQDVSLEERVEVLKEFKSKDYREKWGYELAYLYHRIGMSSECVDECDELIVTFGDGRYVIKAMELKMLHEPLSPSQQAKYDEYQYDLAADNEGSEIPEPQVIPSNTDQIESTDEADLKGAPTTEMPQEMDIQVKTVDVGQYNTINLQEALAESMKDIWIENGEQNQSPSSPEEDIEDNTIFGTSPLVGTKYVQDSEVFDENSWQNTGEIEVDTQPVDIPEEKVEPEEVSIEPKIEATDIPVSTPISVMREIRPVQTTTETDILSEETKRIPTESIAEYLETQRIKQEMQDSSASMQAVVSQAEQVPGAITGKLEPEGDLNSEYDHMLAQEYDGQIRLAISEAEKIEKQITGQLSIDDILADWEDAKKENERKREEEVKQRILQHTGSLFDEFDEDTRATLLAQLEKAFMDAIVKEAKGQGVDSDDLGKKIRKEAIRAVEYLAKDSNLNPDDEEETELVSEVEESAEEFENEEEVTSEEDSENIADDDDDDIEEDEDIEEVQEDEESVEDDETAEDEEPETDIDESEEDEEYPDDVEEDSEEADSAEVEAIRKALEEDEEESKEKKKASKKSVQDEPEEDSEDVEETPTDEEGNRVLSDEEEEFFAAYIAKKSTRKQIAFAMDNMSMAAYTGNVIVTGEEGVGTIDLAKKLIAQMQSMDANFVGQQVAKISGKGLNGKDINEILEKINGGAMIIESARGMKKSTVEKLIKGLESETLGVLVILEDTAEGMDRIVSALPKLNDLFNVRIDLKALDDKALVNYACEYALSQEYAIDEYAILALHTRIEEMQTSDHQVTVAEVRDLVDDAIYFADKKTPGHFFDIIFHKRYDQDDMIILREKDFMHY